MPSRWAAAQRVLLLRLDNLGDVLMTTPALAAVRACLPAAHLTLLAAPGVAALHRHWPWLDEALGFDAPWVKAGAQALADLPRGDLELDLVDRLRRTRFEAAIVFTVCTQSALPAALLCRLAGIPLVLAHSRERGYGLLSDEVRETDVIATGMRHEVRRQLDLVAHIGMGTADERLRFAVQASDRERARALLQDAGLAPQQRWVLMHPGASAPSRRYPAASFAQAALLLQQAGTAVACCAGAQEQPLLDAMAAAAPGIARLGVPPDVGTLAALIEAADVLVANNSAPVHLAAAVGTPVVDLYALTNPQHLPWQVNAHVLNHDQPCRHCLQSLCPQGHHRCLRDVTPQEVARAVHLLQRGEAHGAQPHAA
jgi:ADP-heptose:LPS heptosyltransferase